MQIATDMPAGVAAAFVAVEVGHPGHDPVPGEGAVVREAPQCNGFRVCLGENFPFIKSLSIYEKPFRL